MFNDDVSEIPQSGCNVLNNPTTIYNYSNSTRRTYTNVGGKWIYSGNSPTSTQPVNAVCIDVTQLKSNAQFEPLFYLVAFILFVATILLFRWSVRGIIGRY